MSESTEPDFNLELHFLPSWAKKPADANRYSNYEGESGRGGKRPRRGPERFGPRPPHSRRDQGPGAGGREGRDSRGPRSGPGGPRRPPRDQKPFEPAPLPDLNVSIVPDDLGVDSLAKQIRMTGRAYPLFEIARMVLQKPERHSFSVSVLKGEDGQPKQALFSCAIDESVWLSEEAAVRYILDKHFDLFYQAERTAVEPPKGTYTFVAQCGMSGVVLGPPNYHDYQKNLRELHARRFSKMNFEAFKSRVKIVKDEEVVKKWLDEKSFTTEYQCLNLPEPLKLGSREEVEKHFRETHLPNVLRQVDTVHIKGVGIKDVRAPALARLLRNTLEDQRRFPLQVVTVLSQQFASRGLQFFKVNKSVTHVCVARPHYLDVEATPVSDNIKRILRFIDEHKGATRKELIDTLAPPAPAAASDPAPAPESASGDQPTDAPAESPALATPPPEVTAIITDLHWLVHQGHVIEFATGTLETAKKPLPRQEKQAKPGKRSDAPTQPAASPPSSGSGESPKEHPSTGPSPAGVPAASVAPAKDSGPISPAPPDSSLGAETDTGGTPSTSGMERAVGGEIGKEGDVETPAAPPSAPVPSQAPVPLVGNSSVEVPPAPSDASSPTEPVAREEKPASEAGSDSSDKKNP